MADSTVSSKRGKALDSKLAHLNSTAFTQSNQDFSPGLGNEKDEKIFQSYLSGPDSSMLNDSQILAQSDHQRRSKRKHIASRGAKKTQVFKSTGGVRQFRELHKEARDEMSLNEKYIQLASQHQLPQRYRPN